MNAETRPTDAGPRSASPSMPSATGRRMTQARHGAPPVPSADWRRSVRAGYAMTILGFGSFLAWSMLARLDGAALANGVIAFESNRRTLQHLEGGIVRELLVRDGDSVQQGQVLVRLDPTRADAQNELYGNQLIIFMAQEARLLAERDGLETLQFPPPVMARAAEPLIVPVIRDQQLQFESRMRTMRRNVELAEAQIVQARKDIEQNAVDLATARDMMLNVERELSPLQDLLKRGLVSVMRVTVLERELLRLNGILGNGKLQREKLAERLQEAELRREQAVQDHRNEAAGQLLEVRRLLNDVRQQLVVVNDQQNRAELRAPVAGTVQQLRIFTEGGVVRPGDPILDLVPASDVLVIRAKISPLDVDRVSTGMAAELRFPAFRYFGSDVVRGVVRTISRDRLLEADGQSAYFAAEVTVDRGLVPAEMLGKLSAGMPADVILPTGERTVMSYLMAPIFERFNLSMRER